MEKMKGLFGFGPGLALPTHGKPKYWRTFSLPTPYQIIGVKMNWRAEASAGTPNNWIQSKQCPCTWSTPIIWLGSLGLLSKHALSLIIRSNYVRP
jgi:hypothetical protein